MRLTWKLVTVATVLILTGCQTASRQSVPLVPALSPEIVKIRDNKPCASPAPASQKITPSWKYGCFCGKGHPPLIHPSERQGSALSESERNELILEYYAIKPLDDIDAACRAHDICWILNGRSEIACNKAFRDAMDEIRSNLRSRIGWFDTETTEWRCSILALDMAFTSNTIMEGDSGDMSMRISNWLSKMLTSPLVVLYGGIHLFSSAISAYPNAAERCDMTR